MTRGRGTSFGTLTRDSSSANSRDDMRTYVMLLLWRPHGPRQWRRWHIVRGKARRLLARQPDGPELTAMLGLDPAAEAELIHRLETTQ